MSELKHAGRKPPYYDEQIRQLREAEFNFLKQKLEDEQARVNCFKRLFYKIKLRNLRRQARIKERIEKGAYQKGKPLPFSLKDL